MRNTLFHAAALAAFAGEPHASAVCGIDLGLFPTQPSYDTGAGGGSSAPGSVGLGIVKLERKTIVNPAMAPASSPGDVPKQTAGTAIALTVPKGATKLYIMKGALREVDGSGDEDDLSGADVKILAGADLMDVKEADALSLTPQWDCDDNDTKAKGTIACDLLLFWF